MRNIPSVSLLPVDALNVYDLVYQIMLSLPAAIEGGGMGNETNQEILLFVQSLQKKQFVNNTKTTK